MATRRGFKGGHLNPYNVLKAENEGLRRQIAELRERPRLLEFTRSVGDDLMFILAQTPFEDWPSQAKNAFKNQERRTPTLAWLIPSETPKVRPTHRQQL